MFRQHGIQIGYIQAQNIIQIVQMIQVFGNQIGQTVLRLMASKRDKYSFFLDLILILIQNQQIL